MKRLSWMMLGIGLLWAASAGAVPVDLSTFGVFPPESAGFVSVSGNNATIREDPAAMIVGLFNDTFSVGAADTALTFDYAVALDGDESPDSFVFWVRSADLVDTIFQETLVGSGSYSFNLAPYQTGVLSIEWALHAGEGASVGSVAELFNVDVTRPDTNPVPEPGTLVLLGSGLLGLVQTARRKRRSAK